MAPTAGDSQENLLPSSISNLAFPDGFTSPSMFPIGLYPAWETTEDGTDQILDTSGPNPSCDSASMYHSALQTSSEGLHSPKLREPTELRHNFGVRDVSSYPSAQSPSAPNYLHNKRRPSTSASSGGYSILSPGFFDSPEIWGNQSGFSTTPPSAGYSSHTNPSYLNVAHSSGQLSSPEMPRRHSIVSLASETSIYSHVGGPSYSAAHETTDLVWGLNPGLGIHSGVIPNSEGNFESEAAHIAAGTPYDPEHSPSTFDPLTKRLNTQYLREKTHGSIMPSIGPSPPFNPIPSSPGDIIYSNNPSNPVNRLQEIPISPKFSFETVDPFPYFPSVSIDSWQPFPQPTKYPNIPSTENIPPFPPSQRIPLHKFNRIPISAPTNGRCPHPNCKKRIVKDLQSHLLSHQPSRPQKCPISNCMFHIKGFARKFDRNRHILTHFKDVVECGFCPVSASPIERSFNRTDLFKKHLISNHHATEHDHTTKKPHPGDGSSILASENNGKQNIAQCSICSELFDDVQAFYRHLDDCVRSRVMRHEKENEEEGIYGEDEEEKENFNHRSGW